MKALKKLVVAAAVCVMGTSMAHAAVISYNFDNNGTVGGDGAGSGPVSNAYAGVVSVDHWYNDWPSYLNTDLVDSSGNATTMDIGWSNNSGTWAIQFAHPGQDSDLSWNKELLNGYLNGTGPAGVSITLSEIPYAQYDLIVYLTSDDATRTGTVTDGATTYDFNVLDNMIAGPDALLVQTTSTDGSNPEANYAVFGGLSGATQTVSTDFGATYGGISGIQVVQIPEPATIGLVGFFGAGVLFVRRRFKI